MPALTPPASLDESFSQPKIRMGSLLISFLVCSLIVLGFVLTSDQCVHWFVLPVLGCGIIIGTDAVDWLRGRFNLMDPAGILGLLGFHFFYLTPLLHVHWNQWMGYVVPPPDWRPWLGGMAVINCLGLLVYRLSRGPRDLPRPQSPRQPAWKIGPRKFIPIVTFALVITGLLQLLVYQSYGGITGYIARYTEITEAGFDSPPPEGFKGMGLLFTMSESFPVLAIMVFTIFASRRKIARSWLILTGALLIYFVLLMLFGGLRGIRSNTIFSLFWGVGMFHLMVRPIPKKIIFLGLIFVIVFMYLYGFYKDSGLKGFTDALTDESARVQMEKRTGRTLSGAILGDLGRSDVQAFLLFRLWPRSTDYDYAWGRTYLGAVALVVPRTLWSERPSTKVREGTELMFGRGSYRPEHFEAPNVYGLAGEAMLNYGVLAAPLAFIMVGWGVKVVRQFLTTLDRQDLRLLMIPFMVIVIANLLSADSDNIIFFLVKFGAVPFLVIASGSTRSFAHFSSPTVFSERQRLLRTST